MLSDVETWLAVQSIFAVSFYLSWSYAASPGSTAIEEKLQNMLYVVLQSQTEFKALEKAGVTVSWDDSRVVAPKGIINEATGIADLTLADKKGD